MEITDKLDIELSGAPFITLSKSTKFRVGVAFQYALAKLAGARLLMIDEADILDPINRAALLNFLVAARDDFDTVMVFATSTNRPTRNHLTAKFSFGGSKTEKRRWDNGREQERERRHGGDEGPDQP